MDNVHFTSCSLFFRWRWTWRWHWLFTALPLKDSVFSPPFLFVEISYKFQGDGNDYDDSKGHNTQWNVRECNWKIHLRVTGDRSGLLRYKTYIKMYMC